MCLIPVPCVWKGLRRLSGTGILKVFDRSNRVVDQCFIFQRFESHIRHEQMHELYLRYGCKDKYRFHY